MVQGRSAVGSLSCNSMPSAVQQLQRTVRSYGCLAWGHPWPAVQTDVFRYVLYRMARRYGVSTFYAPARIEEVLPGFACIPGNTGCVPHLPAPSVGAHHLKLSPSLTQMAADVATGPDIRNAADVEVSARSALERAPVRRAAERERWLELPIEYSS